MSEWLRRFRAYLIVFPLALIIGFGFHVYQAQRGLGGPENEPEDVPKGDTAKLGPATVRLLDVSVDEPQSGDDSGSASTVPSDAVVVVAKFRGRIDDAARAKKDEFGYCGAKVENGDGWVWESESLSGDSYVPKNVSKSCDGSRMDKDFKKVKPDEGEWYEFAYVYLVPKDRATGLRPTLSFSTELPRYLRFAA